MTYKAINNKYKLLHGVLYSCRLFFLKIILITIWRNKKEKNKNQFNYKN